MFIIKKEHKNMCSENLKKYFYINSGSFIQYVLKVMLEVLVNVLIKHIKFTLYWGQGGKSGGESDSASKHHYSG